MHKLSKENRRIYEEVVKGLRDLVRETANKLQPKLVIAYGSFARGDWHQGSDIDILLISDNIPSNFKERWDILYTVMKGFPIEPHLHTTKEFEEMLIHGRMTVLDALTEGVTLYADDKFMKKTNQMLKEVMKKLKPKKTHIGWELTKP